MLASARLLEGFNQFDYNIKSDGNVTVSATSPALVDAALDILLPARNGDTIMAGVSAFWSTGGSSNVGRLDVGTLVSSSVVTYFSSGTGTNAPGGVAAWETVTASSEHGGVGGGVMCQLGSGDISSGLVTLRLLAFTTSTTRTLRADSGRPLHFWAVNLGQRRA